MINCLYCNREFTPQHFNTKLCSDECRREIAKERAHTQRRNKGIPKFQEYKDCKRCGVNIKCNSAVHVYCDVCSKIVTRETNKKATKKYRGTEKAKAVRKLYMSIEENRRASLDATRRFRSSEKGKKYLKDYSKSEMCKNTSRRYRQSEKGRAGDSKRSKKYYSTEKGKLVARKNATKHRHNKRAGGEFDIDVWNEKLVRLNHRCVYCGTKENIGIDHIVPVSRGGSNHVDNLQPLCRSCNSRKSNSLIKLFEIRPSMLAVNHNRECDKDVLRVDELDGIISMMKKEGYYNGNYV